VTEEHVDGTDEGEGDDAPEVELAYGVPVAVSRGQRVLHPTRDQLLGVVEELRSDGYLVCVDLCGVDYSAHPGRSLPLGVVGERFEVVVNVLNHLDRDRVRLRVQVPEDDPTLPSLFDQYPGTEAMEREAYDMFGLTFDDHPDLSRILMPEDWVGYPLRKDFAVGSVPVQFKGAPEAR